LNEGGVLYCWYYMLCISLLSFSSKQPNNALASGITGRRQDTAGSSGIAWRVGEYDRQGNMTCESLVRYRAR
jgi:hypothetical protein